MPNREGLAQVIDYWRRVEMFDPPGAPAVNRRGRVYRVEPGSRLPWESGHELRQVKLPPRMTWRFAVYSGLFPVGDLYRELDEVCGAERDEFTRPVRSHSAIAGFELDASGVPVPDSSILSTAAWGLGSAKRAGRLTAFTLDGFGYWESIFGKLFEESIYSGWDLETLLRKVSPRLYEDDLAVLMPLVELAARYSGFDVLSEIGGLLATQRGGSSLEGARPRLPMTVASLKDSAAVVTTLVGLETLVNPDKPEIRIECKQVLKEYAAEPGELDFLNSFLAKDLRTIATAVRAGDLGAALTTYLDQNIEKNRRVDVRADLDQVRRAVAPDALPGGCWPSEPGHPLALNQQLAVAESVNTLGAGEGLFSVNGPPGTGKTTQLRDLIAGLVTRRAEVLARLKKPQDAFDSAVNYPTPRGNRSIPMLIPELTGYEIVVSASTNGAVDNVTKEIPGTGAIAERWLSESDYYSDIATTTLNYARSTYAQDPEGKTWKPAWALMAARLGNLNNRKDFRKAFWFGLNTEVQNGNDGKKPKGPERPGFKDLLVGWRRTPPKRPWAEAVKRFRAAERVVAGLREERAQGPRLDREVARLEIALGKHRILAASAFRQVSDLTDQLTTAASTMRNAEAVLHKAETRWRGHRDHRPGFVEALFTLGRAIREWRVAGQELAARVAETRRVFDDTESVYGELVHTRATADREHRRLDELRHQTESELSAVRGQRAALRQRLGEFYPDEDYWSQREVRERHAPWVDAEFNAARTRLFLAALDLHRDFVRHAADQLFWALWAVSDFIGGGAPENRCIARCAWQAFFLVVPVVSTTFASLPRLFGKLGPGDLGWFVVDEAGQAAPQAVVSGAWRARRFVAVGDPLQLEPVVTVPESTQRALRVGLDIPDLWLPGSTSAQSLVDRQASLGTSLRDQYGESLWVGVPLSVHRRCDNPMFDIVNTIAYDGTMLMATPTRAEPVLPANGRILPDSDWRHVAAESAEGHWIPAEGRALDVMLARMSDQGQEMSQVFVLSPFADVASRLAGYNTRYPGMRAGTIHTAQGREADIVILVLGGDPAKPGARGWASSKPNLVNVAVSRAKRRLYVIGDREKWSKHQYFDTLAAALEKCRKG